MNAKKMLEQIKGERIYWYNVSTGSAEGYTTIDNDLIQLLANSEVFDLNNLDEAVYEAMVNELSYIDKNWQSYANEFKVVEYKESHNNRTYFLIWLK